MIAPSTIQFLKQLSKNNNRNWFEKNRSKYEEAKNNIEEFVAEIISGISSFDPSIKGLEAKKCVFRIYRDVRFSKNKDPYKTNFGASMNKGGKKANGPGYYIHIEPGQSFLGGGIYMPEPAMLGAVRQEIDYNLDEFNKILKNKEFKKYYNGLWEEDKLKTTPKGYSPDNPAIEFLRNKHFIVSHDMNEKMVLSKDFSKHCVKAFKAMHPFLQFMNRALD